MKLYHWKDKKLCYYRPTCLLCQLKSLYLSLIFSIEEPAFWRNVGLIMIVNAFLDFLVWKFFNFMVPSWVLSVIFLGYAALCFFIGDLKRVSIVKKKKNLDTVIA